MVAAMYGIGFAAKTIFRGCEVECDSISVVHNFCNKSSSGLGSIISKIFFFSSFVSAVDSDSCYFISKVAYVLLFSDK